MTQSFNEENGIPEDVVFVGKKEKAETPRTLRAKRSIMYEFFLVLWVIGTMSQLFALVWVYLGNYQMAVSLSVVGIGLLIASQRKHWW